MDSSIGNIENASLSKIVSLYEELKRQGRADEFEQLVAHDPELVKDVKECLRIIDILDKGVGKQEDARLRVHDVPKNVNGFSILEEIGRGGMGVVFRASQPSLNREVAIKVVSLESDDPELTDARIEREGTAMANLSHPNIIPAYAYTRDKKFAYLAMKLIPGLGLNQLMEGKGDFRLRYHFEQLTTEWSAFARMAADVCSGLHHAHMNGVVHRDIKPGNLILDREGKMWIADFGLAKTSVFEHQISQTGDVIGTPRYMAPEQVQRISDARSDIYSLGITLYEMLVCRTDELSAVNQNDSSRFGEGGLQDIRELVPGIPEDLAFVIMKACSYAPDDRYGSAEELEVVFRRYLDGRVADRRKKRRKPDAVYRKEFYRKAAIFSLVSVSFFSIATYFLTNSQLFASSADRKMSPDDLVEYVTEGGGAEMRETIDKIWSLTKETLVSDLDIPNDEKQRLIDIGDKTHQKFISGNVSTDELIDLGERFRQSSVGLAAKIVSRHGFIDASKLTSKEKEAACETLTALAILVSHDQISPEKASDLLHWVSQGVPFTARELTEQNIQPERIRKWLSMIDTALSHAGAQEFQGNPEAVREAFKVVGPLLGSAGQSQDQEILDQLKSRHTADIQQLFNN